MKREVSVTCPYCGKRNQIVANSLCDDAKLVVCDWTTGGCDRIFVAEINVDISTVTKKIEGEDSGEDDEK